MDLSCNWTHLFSAFHACSGNITHLLGAGSALCGESLSAFPPWRQNIMSALICVPPSLYPLTPVNSKAGWPIHFSLRHKPHFFCLRSGLSPGPAACITFQPGLSVSAERAQSERGGLSGVNRCRVGRAERMTCLGRRPNLLPSPRLRGSVRM